MKIAQNLDFPLSAVTETFGYLACRGSGKTNANRVVAEAFFDAKVPFVVVDPVGSWWGLLSSRDGKRPGLPILVLGGKHGHLPLERDSGELVADLVVEHRLSCVLDLSTFESEGTKKKFLLDFARRLYAKNEEPLHLFLEEADDYIPQRPMREEAQLLRAWENIVRRGRARGLGMSMITTLVALRTTGPQDRAAVEAWLKYNDQSEKILAELPKLANGEAWVWSPNFLKETKKVRFPLSRTFDSGATPTGAKRAAATLADVDLGAIEKRMAATVERARAEDPKLLRRRIAELERELAKKAPPPAVEHRRFFDQGAFDEMVRRAQGAIGDAALRAQQEAAEAFESYRKRAEDSISEVKSIVAAAVPRRGFRPPARLPLSNSGFELKAMHRAMLTALAQHPDGLTKRQVLIHTGYAASGPVSTAFADLLRSGFVAADGRELKVTPDGLRALGPFDPLPLGRDLQKWLLTGDKLSTMEKALLREICAAYPKSIRKREVLERAEYAASGPVSTAFAKLVAYGYAVAQGSGTLRAAEELF